MHELAIAQAVVDIVERHAAGRRVERVELRVGRLRQVVPSALRFGFELAARDTVAEGAELEIVDVPVGGRCRACGGEGDFDAFPFACALCGSRDVELTRGEELLVEALEVEEVAA
jgi:hydrogenase nickel incorporation protein HypA/HybF